MKLNNMEINLKVKGMENYYFTVHDYNETVLIPFATKLTVMSFKN